MEKFIKWGFDKRLIRDSWNGGTNLSFEKDLAYGHSWPQRSYRCSFCRKEFKSAQALGGHMNVHRRDRARMRLSPCWDSPNPNPNTNPSSLYSSLSTWSPISSAAKPYNNHSSLTAATNSSSSPAQVQINQHSQLQILNLFEGDNGSKNKGGATLEFTRRKDARVCKAEKEYTKEGLDLELRLGYS